jgi:DNA-binding MarR family transcriptional regulator
MPSHERRTVSITLSPAQVDAVVRAAARGRTPRISTLIADSLHVRADEAAAAGVPSELRDRRLSRSLLRGLSLLRCFRSSGAPRGIVELARELEMSPSTAHRYAVTLVELGLLERCPNTRKYRLPDG